MTSTFVSLCNQTLYEIYSFLDFASAVRLYATGSGRLRDKNLRKHIGLVRGDDLPFMTDRIEHLRKATMKEYSQERDQKVDLLLSIKLGLAGMDNLRVFKLNIHVDFSKIGPFLATTLEKIYLIDDIDKSSLFERFNNLVILSVYSFVEYDAPLPASLKTLKIGEIDDHSGDEDDELGEADERVDFKRITPNLTYLDSVDSYADCVNLPSSLLKLKIQNVRDPENLAKCCPNLRRLAASYLNYKRMKLPKTITRMTYDTTSYNMGFDRVEDEAGLLKDFVIDLEGDDVRDLATQLNLRSFNGQGDCSDLKPYMGVKNLNMTTRLRRTLRMSQITNVNSISELPMVTEFPTFMTRLHITTILMNTSTLMKLPDCIEHVYVCATFSHDFCDLTSKKYLRDLTLTPVEKPVIFLHSILLPSSLKFYSNVGAMMTKKHMPLPNLSTLNIALDPKMDLHLLPITLRSLIVMKCHVSRKYTPINGYRWRYEEIRSEKQGEIHISGLVYMPVKINFKVGESTYQRYE